MTVKEFALSIGTIVKENHAGSVVVTFNNRRVYMERTSFGYIYTLDGTTYRFDTIEELKDALMKGTYGQ
jgi:hypothetical protein